MFLGTSLVVQWLRTLFYCRGHGFDPWLGNLRSRMLQGAAKKNPNKMSLVCDVH